jgi:threonine/homoserine/homoserine lactone efflux protein
MVPLDQLVAFGVVAVVLIAIPGPSVVFTVGRALAYGRAHALTTVAGNSLGLLTIVVLPQFADRASGHLAAQLVVLGLVAVLIGLLSDSLWAVIASQLRSWFLASHRRGESLGLVGGLSMVGLGVTLAVTGRAD